MSDSAKIVVWIALTIVLIAVVIWFVISRERRAERELKESQMRELRARVEQRLPVMTGEPEQRAAEHGPVGREPGSGEGELGQADARSSVPPATPERGSAAVSRSEAATGRNTMRGSASGYAQDDDVDLPYWGGAPRRANARTDGPLRERSAFGMPAGVRGVIGSPTNAAGPGGPGGSDAAEAAGALPAAAVGGVAAGAARQGPADLMREDDEPDLADAENPFADQTATPVEVADEAAAPEEPEEPETPESADAEVSAVADDEPATPDLEPQNEPDELAAVADQGQPAGTTAATTLTLAETSTSFRSADPSVAEVESKQEPERSDTSAPWWRQPEPPTDAESEPPIKTPALPDTTASRGWAHPATPSLVDDDWVNGPADDEPVEVLQQAAARDADAVDWINGDAAVDQRGVAAQSATPAAPEPQVEPAGEPEARANWWHVPEVDETEAVAFDTAEPEVPQESAPAEPEPAAEQPTTAPATSADEAPEPGYGRSMWARPVAPPAPSATDAHEHPDGAAEHDADDEVQPSEPQAVDPMTVDKVEIPALDDVDQVIVAGGTPADDPGDHRGQPWSTSFGDTTVAAPTPIGEPVTEAAAEPEPEPESEPEPEPEPEHDEPEDEFEQEEPEHEPELEQGPMDGAPRRERRISGFDEVRDGGHGIGSAAPIDDGAQPLGHPVKALKDSMTFVAPGDEGYDDAEADVWFFNAEAARRAGFSG